MSNKNKHYWLISRNKDGTTWQVSASDGDAKMMFDGAELLTIIAAYPKDEYSFDEVKEKQVELMIQNNTEEIRLKKINKHFYKYIYCAILFGLIIGLLLNFL